ncbi:MAG: hypothetical protein WCA36_16610 [Pseudolabrys sp.]
MSHGQSPAQTKKPGYLFFETMAIRPISSRNSPDAQYFSFFKHYLSYNGRFFFLPSARTAGAASVEELAQWLKSQHKGLRTYKTFHQKVLELGAQHKQQYALYYLLAMLVWRFVDSYEDSPLTADVTDEAHKHLVAVAERCARFDAMPAEERLTFLNEIAAMELTQGQAPR